MPRSGPENGPPKGGSGGSLGLVVVAVLVLAAVVVTVLALRPGEGETAAGTDRQPTTTTTIAPTTTTTNALTSEPAQAAGDSVDGFEGVDSVELPASLDPFSTWIVEADLGYWMLAGQRFEGNSSLYRSIDGLTWTEVETDFVVPAELPNEPERIYSNLVTTDDGLALLRETFDFQTGVASDMERIVSADGLTWELDATYDTPEDPLGLRTWFTMHTAEVVAYPSGETGSSGFDELLRGVVRPEVELPESVCWVDTFDIAIVVHPCERANEVELEADDFLEPERFPEVRGCASAINNENGLSALPTSRTVHLLSSGTTNEFESSGLTLTAGVQSDGTVIAVDVGKTDLSAQMECDGLVDLPKGSDPVIEVWHPDGSVASSPLPDGVEIDPLFWDGPPPFVIVDRDDEVYVSFDRELWHFETLTGEWSNRVTFDRVDPTLFEPIQVAFGRAVAAGNGSLHVGDLRTGEIITIEYAESSSGFSEEVVIHLDETYAFVSKYDGKSYRIELPLAE